SIATDRSFIARDMPELDAFLHYRMVDVSSIKELCRRWYPRVYFAQPAKGLAHRALADIRESIRELRYYRQTVFVPMPGPTSEGAQPAAAQVRGTEPCPPRPACPRPASPPAGRESPGPPSPQTELLRGPPGRSAIIRPSRRTRAAVVGVAQLVEHRVVVPGVEGSSPFTHPRVPMFEPRPRKDRGSTFRQAAGRGDAEVIREPCGKP